MTSVTKPSLRTPLRLCDREERGGKQSTSQTPGCPTIDCHGLRPRRDNAASLRAPPSLCERSEAIHLTDPTVLNHRLPRPTASQRRVSINCRAATLLAVTVFCLCDREERGGQQSTLQTPSRLCERSEAIHFADRTVSNHGLPPRYAPRRDGVLSLRPRGTWREAIHLSNHARPVFQHIKRHYNANIFLLVWILGIILPFIVCMIKFSALYCLLVHP